MKIIFVLSLLLATVTGYGQKNKMRILSELNGMKPYSLSSNGKYISGGTQDRGFIYNVLIDSIDIYEGASITGVSNNKQLQGEGTFNNIASSVGVYDTAKKQWRRCPVLPAMEENPSQRSSSGYGISGNGKTSIGMIYDKRSGVSVYLGSLWEDTILKQVLTPAFPIPSKPADAIGYGGRPNGISEDGKIIVGFGSRPDYQIQRTPHYWTSDGTAHYLGNDVVVDGEAYGVSPDNTKIAGYTENSIATIWNVADKSFKQVKPLPGWFHSSFNSINNDELAFGYVQGTQISSRMPFIYGPANGAMSLKDYCFELYGFDLGNFDLFTGMFMSSNGRVFVGWTPANGSSTTWVITLDSVKIAARPLNFNARQIKNTSNVNLKWTAPYHCDKELLGYNIYRDSVKVNANLLTTLNYEDASVPKGKHHYAVTAVYKNNMESSYSNVSSVDAIDPNGCYSVKYISSELIYNRSHQFHWGNPTSEIQNSMALASNEIILDHNQMENTISKSPDANSQKLPNSKSYINADLDILGVKDLKAFGISSVINIDGSYYSGSYDRSPLYKYDENWNIVENIVIPNLPAVRNFQKIGESLYAICGTKFIYEIDMENKEIIGQIALANNAIHFAYIPELDGGNGGFEYGNWNESQFIKMDGTLIEEGFQGFEGVSGTTYFDGKVYAYSQSGTSLNEITVYDVASKQATGKKLNVENFPEIKDLATSGSLAGGLSLTVMEDSTIALAAVNQIINGKHVVAFLELKSMPGLAGFKVFRNDELISGNAPLEKHNITDVLEVPGTYNYYIQSVFENGCISEKSEPFSVTILPSVGCGPMKNIAAKEQNSNVVLTYEMPNEYAAGKILGVNIYRNGVKINDKLHDFLSYIDRTVEVGTYTYRVEAFYDNSCTGSDSIEFEVTKQGSCEPVEYIYLNSKVKDATAKTFDVNASWGLPFFEEPFLLRWGNGSSAQKLGLKGTNLVHVAVGWDSNQLKAYRGYEVVGVELIILDDTKITPFALLNEKMATSESNIKYTKDQYFEHFFETPVSLVDAWELVVGFKAELNEEMSPLSADAGPSTPMYGDLYSPDLVNWYSLTRDLKLNANWTIAAILAKPREVSTSQAINYPVSDGIITLSDQPCNITAFSKEIEPIYAPAEIKLQGFNIYRDNTKLNGEELLKVPSYKDENLAEGRYIYKIGAIYSTCGEVMSISKSIQLVINSIDDAGNRTVKMYPNPTTDGKVFIEGDYLKVDVLDVFGRYITSFKSSNELNLSSLSKGLYTLRFTHENQKISNQKLIIK